MLHWLFFKAVAAELTRPLIKLTMISRHRHKSLMFPVAGTVGITGEQTIGSVLTVNPDLSDENGLGELSYQWQLNGSDIDGENLLTLTIPDIAADGVIAVTVTFVDGDGFSESVTSQPINIIQNPSVVQKTMCVTDRR